MKQRLSDFWAHIRAIPQTFRNLPIKTKQLTSLGLTVAMLVALPLFVFTITNLNLNPQKKAASGEVPTPSPVTPSPECGLCGGAPNIPCQEGLVCSFEACKVGEPCPTQGIGTCVKEYVGSICTSSPTPTPICKTGVNSFSVDAPCPGGYALMTFSCYDGFGRTEGGPGSCKSSETWSSYAKKYCEGHSSCTLPPTPTPTPTPPPTNHPPKITTGNLPSGKLNKSYSAKVQAVDVDKGDVLKMNAAGLPNGLSFGGCKTSTLTISCSITGTPKKIGTFNTRVTVTDSKGDKATKTFKVTISR